MKRRNISRVRQAGQTPANGQKKIHVLLISLICVAVVAAGFFLAARQHFATMEFGLKNSQLRKQVADLEAERRRLILAKEVSLSPAAITQNAAKFGFREQMATPPSAADARVAKSEPPTTPAAEHASLKTQSVAPTTVAKPGDNKKLVKTIVQQTTIKPSSPNERPRIAPTEAVAVAQTKAAKLR